MRGLTRFFLSVGAVALLASPALAQRGGGFFGGGMGSPAMLIMNKGVQKEIKLDDAQAQKAESVAREKMEAMRGRFQDIPKEQRKEKGQQVMRETNAEVNKALADILKPEQKKRFDQIVLQQRGAQGLTDEAIQAKLKLTGDQKTKIDEVIADSGQQMREIFQGAGGGGFNEETRQKVADLRKETNNKAVAVLTSEQKATYKEMTGEPFEVKFEPPGGGR